MISGGQSSQGGADTSWRLCIDLGTAASKASLCAKTAPGAEKTILPLEIGWAAGDANPYLAPSYLLFDTEYILFGSAALERAAQPDSSTDPLHSFKTFLGSRDLDTAIALRLRRNVDEQGEFTQRDALVLYASYLLRLVEVALARTVGVPEGAAQAPRRYAFPLWNPGDRANEVVREIFNEAQALCNMLGPAIENPDGITRKLARHALDHARQAPADCRIEAGVFEALAAAESHFAFSHSAPPFVLVLDMGAGTTDLTAFERDPTGNTEAMREIPGARQTAMLACDEIDKLLVSYMFDRVRGEKRTGARQQLWRRLIRRSRILKENLFRDGVCETTHEGQRIVVRMSDFLADRDFSRFLKAVSEFYMRGLNRLAVYAGEKGAKEIGVVLAGGGSALSCIQAMAAKMRPTKGKARKVLVQPLLPDWTRRPQFNDRFRNSFPQIAISIGGAVATIDPPLRVRP